ncbi:hypothetical protein AK812_SmicGene49068 [Symbiodinium microadriaticum]|uniref:Uncharacterized protein n=1 Tax=Symbiodinium microadriaticum TaxID=2951 RepID=A0A1Q9C6I6_SYMMI|nr:hypothetical protein AK812_SmicGene49068 [Symbiodinium microadriaticum]
MARCPTTRPSRRCRCRCILAESLDLPCLGRSRPHRGRSAKPCNGIMIMGCSSRQEHRTSATARCPAATSGAAPASFRCLFGRCLVAPKASLNGSQD